MQCLCGSQAIKRAQAGAVTAWVNARWRPWLSRAVQRITRAPAAPKECLLLRAVLPGVRGRGRGWGVAAARG
eukprot:944111-Prymnesium_polylepis.1